eukprot:s1165_g10.t1
MSIVVCIGIGEILPASSLGIHVWLRSCGMWKAGATEPVRFFMFDFDQTLTVFHVFKSLSGWKQEGVCASIPKPHAMSELGQVARIDELSSGEFATQGGFPCAAFGGNSRVEEVRRMLQSLQKEDAEMVICTKGFVGPVQFCLHVLGLRSYFTQVYGHIGVTYGTSPFDKQVIADPPALAPQFLGEAWQAEWRSKDQLMVKLLQQKGLKSSQGILVEDDPEEVRRANRVCRLGRGSGRIRAMYIFGTSGRRADPPRSKGEGGNKISLAQSLGSSSGSPQRKQSYESPVTTVGEVTPARSWTSSHYETSPHAGLGTSTFFGTAPPPRQEGPPLLFTSPTPPPSLVPLAPPAAPMMLSPPVFSGPPCAAPSLPPNISMCSFQAPPPPPAAAPKMAPQPYTFHTDSAAASLQSTAANAQGDLDDQSSKSTVTKEAPSPEEKEEVSRFDSKSSRRRWADIVNDSDDDDPWNVNTSVGATPSSCSSPVPSSQEPSSAQPTCTTSADTAALGCTEEPATEDNTESTEEVLEPLHEELHETSPAPKLEPAASEGKRAKPSCGDQITSIKDCATDFPCLDIDCSQDSVALSTVADSIDCMSSIADCPEVDITESLPDIGEAAGLGGLGSAVKKRKKKKSAKNKKTEVVDLSRTSSVVSEVASRRSSRSAPSETSSTTSATGKRSASKSQSSKRPDTSQPQGAFPSAKHVSQFQAGLASCASTICDNPRWAILMLLAAVVFGGKCWLRIHAVEDAADTRIRRMTMFVKEGKGITSVQMEQLARLAAGEDLAARGTGTTGCRSGCLLM